jgi:hypothetical protein
VDSNRKIIPTATTKKNATTNAKAYLNVFIFQFC